MHDSQRYRRNAADCLLAARKSPEPRYQKRDLLPALSWFLLPITMVRRTSFWRVGT